MAAYIAEQQRTVALAEAELRRTEIEAEAQLAQTLALSEGEELLPDGARRCRQRQHRCPRRRDRHADQRGRCA